MGRRPSWRRFENRPQCPPRLVPASPAFRDCETAAAEERNRKRREQIEKLQLCTEGAALRLDLERFALNNEDERHDEIERDHQCRRTCEDPKDQQHWSDNFGDVDTVADKRRKVMRVQRAGHPSDSILELRHSMKTQKYGDRQSQDQLADVVPGGCGVRDCHVRVLPSNVRANRAYPPTPPSVISSPRSMIANASRSCSSVMQSGGLVKRLFQLMKAYMPRSRRKAPSFCISGLVPLNGAIGSFVSRLRTSSRTPNSPMERTSPTDRCFACIAPCS